MFEVEKITIHPFRGKLRQGMVGCIVWMTLTLSFDINAQILNRNTTYESLFQTQKKIELEWTNPDGSSEKIKLVEMTIPVTEELRALTLEFEKKNYNYSSIWLKPRIVVVHAMDLDDLKSSLEQSSFLNDRMPDSWGNLSRAGALPNGAHFIIDVDGTIYCLTPPMAKEGKAISYERDNHQWFVRRHQDANPLAIGIENVTPADGHFNDLNDVQIAANAKLIRWLKWFEHGNIHEVTSHHQFNDEAFLDSLLAAYGIRHLQKAFRTVERKDVGLEVIRKIKAQAR